MKKIMIMICLIIQADQIWACDACGTSVTSGYVGILPQFTKHFVGLKYQYRWFSSHTLGDPQQKIANQEFYHTLNMYGRFSPHKRVQILVNIPVNYYVQHDQGKINELAGPGDIWTLCMYQLVRTPDSSTTKKKQSFMLGGGIKLPTGRYNMYDATGYYDRNMQPGTGSWDFLVSANYTVRWGGWGMNLESLAKIATINPDNYLYGHQLNGSIKGFYWGKRKSISYILSCGLSYDYKFRDFYLHQWQPNTGGHLLSADITTDVYLKKWAFGMDMKIPVYSLLAGGLVHPGLQVSPRVLFMF